MKKSCDQRDGSDGGREVKGEGRGGGGGGGGGGERGGGRVTERGDGVGVFEGARKVFCTMQTLFAGLIVMRIDMNTANERSRAMGRGNEKKLVVLPSVISRGKARGDSELLN